MSAKFSINDLLSEYSQIRLATESDNEEILKFCSEINMSTSSMSLRYERSPDYFAFLKEQTSRYFVFVFLNKDDSIGGVCSVVLKQQYIDGELCRLAYLCDLRTSPSLYRLARVQWRNCYAKVVAGLRDIIEFEECKYFYSAVFSDNQIAQEALVKRNRHYVYRELGSYHAVSVIFKKFWQKKETKSDRFVTENISENNENELRLFLNTEMKQQTLGEHIEAEKNEYDELARRLKGWHNFSLNDFIVVREKRSRKIVATLAPWLQADARRMVVTNLPRSLSVLSVLARAFGRANLKQDGILRVLNLTHFSIDSSLSKEAAREVILQLFNAVFARASTKNSHVSTLILPRHYDSLLEVIQSKFVHTITSGKLYQVMSPRDFSEKRNLPDESAAPIAFEVGIA